MFPFNLPIGVEVNTKMVIAAFGLIIFVMDRVIEKEFRISNDFLWLSLLAILISIWSLCSMAYNHTSDGTYASYFMSLWVWLGGAYAVVWLIRKIHGSLTVETIGSYLVGVCVCQCLLAYAMTLFPPLQTFIDSLIGSGDAYMSKIEGRMYGLGAALDPSGLRFAAVLTIDTHLFIDAQHKEKGKRMLIYAVAFVIIAVIGNMISRSTTVGIIISILFASITYVTQNIGNVNIKNFAFVSIFLIVGIFFLVWLYRHNPSFRANLRFGFEGFFSLAEKGRWEVSSNEILKNMVVWPETLKTWIIGDGYCENPNSDPNFLGVIRGGYYMGTDIGYLRFIFYFGIPGLLMMIGVFVKVATTCIKNLKGYEGLFLMLLLSNFTGWFKVTSDILMVFAPFLILALQKEEQKDGMHLYDQLESDETA